MVVHGVSRDGKHPFYIVGLPQVLDQHRESYHLFQHILSLRSTCATVILQILSRLLRGRTPAYTSFHTHCKAGITPWAHSGEVPAVQRISCCIQQQALEEEGSNRSGGAEQTWGAGRTSVDECGLGHSDGLEPSGICL